MRTNRKGWILLTVAVMCMMVSCMKDQKLPSVLDELGSIDDVTLSAGQTSAVKTVTVSLRNVVATIIDAETNETCTWCSLEIGEKTLTLTAQRNEGFKERSAIVQLFDKSQYSDDTQPTTPGLQFMVRQLTANIVKIEESKARMAYVEDSIMLYVKSNVNYAIGKGEADWLSVEHLRTDSMAGYTVKAYVLRPTENTTDEERVATLSFVIEGNILEELKVTQGTNPIITVMQVSYALNKTGGIISIPLKTLSPYEVLTDADWITDKGATKHEMGTYTHTFEVSPFVEKKTERVCELVFHNDNPLWSVNVDVRQMHSFYLKETAVELVIDEEPTKLEYVNLTNKPVMWSTNNSEVVTVDADGTLHPVKLGKTVVTGSIGHYDNLEDYSDEVEVTVRSIEEKVTIVRGFGSYTNSDGYVTANCELTITNEYNRDVRLTSLDLMGENDVHQHQDLDQVLKPGESLKTSFDLDNVLHPKLMLHFLCNDKVYASVSDY